MPRNALNNRLTAHCNDLESLYYLPIIFIDSHTGLNVDVSPLANSNLPYVIQNSSWMLNDRALAGHNMLYFNKSDLHFAGCIQTSGTAGR
ncbi:hypothetical protein JB92DRAFT_3007562 [Gautieria morchelliformis]|nr:hypothetical protein JB92DRAFT_3007562 [Gautieria morchelliformis]